MRNEDYLEQSKSSLNQYITLNPSKERDMQISDIRNMNIYPMINYTETLIHPFWVYLNVADAIISYKEEFEKNLIYDLLRLNSEIEISLDYFIEFKDVFTFMVKFLCSSNIGYSTPRKHHRFIQKVFLSKCKIEDEIILSKDFFVGKNENIRPDYNQLDILVKKYLTNIDSNIVFDKSTGEYVRKHPLMDDSIYSFFEYHLTRYKGEVNDFIKHAIELTTTVWEVKNTENRDRKICFDIWLNKKLVQYPDLDRSKLDLEKQKKPARDTKKNLTVFNKMQIISKISKEPSFWKYRNLIRYTEPFIMRFTEEGFTDIHDLSIEHICFRDDFDDSPIFFSNPSAVFTETEFDKYEENLEDEKDFEIPIFYCKAEIIKKLDTEFNEGIYKISFPVEYLGVGIFPVIEHDLVKLYLDIKFSRSPEYIYNFFKFHCDNYEGEDIHDFILNAMELSFYLFKNNAKGILEGRAFDKWLKDTIIEYDLDPKLYDVKIVKGNTALSSKSKKLTTKQRDLKIVQEYLELIKTKPHAIAMNKMESFVIGLGIMSNQKHQIRRILRENSIEYKK